VIVSLIFKTRTIEIRDDELATIQVWDTDTTLHVVSPYLNDEGIDLAPNHYVEVTVKDV
jgi:hypothetical protein